MKEININVKMMHNVEVWLKRANEDDFKLVKEAHNTSEAGLKKWLRDAMIGSGDTGYMGYNLLYSSSVLGGILEKDGIIVDVGASYYSMITTVHATDPSGNYYRRWTGSFTAPSPVTITGELHLGCSDRGKGSGFSALWATVNIGSWAMGTGDILKVHWKVSLSGADNSFLAELREALYSDYFFNNGRYMRKNGFFNANTLGGISGKDGLYIKTSGGIIYSMITAAHPTDPSGNYYRRWQGVFTASSSISFLGNVYLGTKFNLDGHFDYPWDSDSLSAWDMNLGDILKVNWKVSFS